MDDPTAEKSTALFVGTDTVAPHAEQDTACLLLNRDTLVDTGWMAPLSMLRHGADPMQVDYLFITHCHHDHYLALPQLLFYHAMRRRERPDRPALTIVGPKPDVRDVVNRVLSFLMHERFPDVAAPPNVVPLQAGDEFETDRFHVRTCPTVHPVVGLCYRFRDTRSGGSLAVTGDTAYHEPIARFAEGVEVLVHEASRGPVSSDPNTRGGHSGSVDAAKIASLAGAQQLFLTHYPRAKRESILAAAHEVFPNTHAAMEGDVVMF